MKLGMIGAGNMASALARGLGEPVLVSDAVPHKARVLAAAVGGQAFDSNVEVAERADLVILCHKPAQLAEVASEIGGKARAVVSILAATRIEEVEAAYPGVPVYRFIPNIAVEVGRGVLCYAPGTRGAEGPEREVLELFGRAGIVIPLEEPLIEPAMALMSCGPAFLALVVESLAEAGVRHGLVWRDAARMTVETMAGTAAYLTEHRLDAARLRARVATPGGVTERGLVTLEEQGLPEAFGAAVDVVVGATKR
jgi:pyrroline-5-carboxylate reductase